MNIIRQLITSRGGGIEISLDEYGLEGEKMAVYQNYLGGGLLGAVCVNDTIRSHSPFCEESLARQLDQIGQELIDHYCHITGQDYSETQLMPESAY